MRILLFKLLYNLDGPSVLALKGLVGGGCFSSSSVGFDKYLQNGRRFSLKTLGLFFNPWPPIGDRWSPKQFFSMRLRATLVDTRPCHTFFDLTPVSRASQASF